MGDVVRACCIRHRGVQMEWQQRAYGWVRRVRWVRLLESHTLIGKSTHAAITSEVVIEGSVLLDKNHDMLDIVHRGARRGSRWHCWRDHRSTTTATLQSKRRKLR